MGAGDLLPHWQPQVSAAVCQLMRCRSCQLVWPPASPPGSIRRYLQLPSTAYSKEHTALPLDCTLTHLGSVWLSNLIEPRPGPLRQRTPNSRGTGCQQPSDDSLRLQLQETCALPGTQALDLGPWSLTLRCQLLVPGITALPGPAPGYLCPV